MQTTLSDTQEVYILWSASQVVHKPGHEGSIHLHCSQLLTHQSWTNGVKGTGGAKKKKGSVQHVDYGILNSQVGLVSELKGICKKA